ncbi:MAG: DUF2258 domain-containing protein [Sulfolobales archaeon]|jgi:hypothetical protein|nr:DUF2258 domain-containing protein [Sulfolobales archaeon]
MPQRETEQYQKDEERDLERAEEYEHTTMRASAIGTNKFELSTGIIVAARFADKLRRAALVAFGKMVDKNVVLRDVAELNQELYEEIVNKRKIGKLDVIRIIVDAEYDEKENRIKFSNIRIQHFVPEDECASRENLERLQKENEELRSKLEKIKQMLTAL